MAAYHRRYLQILAYVLVGVICVIAMGVTRDCSGISSKFTEGFSRGDTLDIAIIYAPDSYYMDDDSIGGINHDLALNFSKDTDTPIKIWPLSQPAECMEKLESGVYDIVASLPLDNYIKNRFAVSESVFLDRLVLVQLSDSLTGSKPVNSSLDLNGKKVTVTAGSSALQRLKNLSEEIGGNIEIEESPDLSEELITIKVATGSIPFAVVNERVAKKIAESYPNLNYDSSISFTQFQVWIFNPSDSIPLQKFNSWFDSFRSTPIYQSILSQ